MNVTLMQAHQLEEKEKELKKRAALYQEHLAKLEAKVSWHFKVRLRSFCSFKLKIISHVHCCALCIILWLAEKARLYRNWREYSGNRSDGGIIISFLHRQFWWSSCDMLRVMRVVCTTLAECGVLQSLCRELTEGQRRHSETFCVSQNLLILYSWHSFMLLQLLIDVTKFDSCSRRSYWMFSYLIFSDSLALSRFNIQPVCADLQSEILKCYKENTGKTLCCSGIASAYMQCVDEAKKVRVDLNTWFDFLPLLLWNFTDHVNLIPLLSNAD